jgi:hypothetical protein
MSTLSFNSYQEVLLPGLYPWKAWASIHGPASRLLISYQVQVSHGDTSIWTNYDQPAVCIWFARLSKVPVASWVILVAIQQRETGNATENLFSSSPQPSLKLSTLMRFSHCLKIQTGEHMSMSPSVPGLPDFRIIREAAWFGLRTPP